MLALGSMFMQQTFISLGKSLPAVIAPAIILDLKLAPAWIGIYFGLTAVAAFSCSSAAAASSCAMAHCA